MQESCTCGSVRGALGNQRPYRDTITPRPSLPHAFAILELRPWRTAPATGRGRRSNASMSRKADMHPPMASASDRIDAAEVIILLFFSCRQPNMASVRRDSRQTMSLASRLASQCRSTDPMLCGLGRARVPVPSLLHVRFEFFIDRAIQTIAENYIDDAGPQRHVRPALKHDLRPKSRLASAILRHQVAFSPPHLADTDAPAVRCL
jgi:hypothetical protein